MPAELLAFLGVAALVIVTPGQDTALTIRNTLLGGRTAGVATALGVSSGQAVCTATRQGLLSNLANPKMAIFFTSLLPQFAPADGAAFPVLLGLGLVFCAMTFAWLCAYAAAPRQGARVSAAAGT